MIHSQATKDTPSRVALYTEDDLSVLDNQIRDECECNNPDPELKGDGTNGRHYRVECNTCGKTTEPTSDAIKGEALVRAAMRWNRQT